jgi:dolichol kinase
MRALRRRAVGDCLNFHGYAQDINVLNFNAKTAPMTKMHVQASTHAGFTAAVAAALAALPRARPCDACALDGAALAQTFGAAALWAALILAALVMNDRAAEGGGRLVPLTRKIAGAVALAPAFLAPSGDAIPLSIPLLYLDGMALLAVALISPMRFLLARDPAGLARFGASRALAALLFLVAEAWVFPGAGAQRVAFGAILFTAVVLGDLAAAIVGKSGTFRYPTPFARAGETRTVEGVAAFAFVVSMAAIHWAPLLPQNEMLLTMMFAPLVLAGAEALSPPGWDEPVVIAAGALLIQSILTLG